MIVKREVVPYPATPPPTPEQIVAALLRRRDGISMHAAHLIQQLQAQVLLSHKDQTPN